MLIILYVLFYYIIEIAFSFKNAKYTMYINVYLFTIGSIMYL